MTDEERFRNAVIYGTSHPEMYMTEDDALIEAIARAMFKDDQINRQDIAKAALAVARPIIEAPLRAENEKLRAALKPFAEQVDRPVNIYEHDGVRMEFVDHDVLDRLCRAAKAALGECDE